MQKLKNYLNRIKSLQRDEQLQKAVKNKEILGLIKVLNTGNQLFQGVNAEGVRLDTIGGSYTPFTKKEKIKKGQPTDRVTLFDTGEFYESFSIKAEKDGIIIDADYNKEGDDLRERWGGNLAGLTDESKEELKNELIPKLKDVLRLDL